MKRIKANLSTRNQALIECPSCDNWEAQGVDDSRSNFGSFPMKPQGAVPLRFAHEENDITTHECEDCGELIEVEWDYSAMPPEKYRYCNTLKRVKQHWVEDIYNKLPADVREAPICPTEGYEMTTVSASISSDGTGIVFGHTGWKNDLSETTDAMGFFPVDEFTKISVRNGCATIRNQSLVLEISSNHFIITPKSFKS